MKKNIQQNKAKMIERLYDPIKAREEIIRNFRSDADPDLLADEVISLMEKQNKTGDKNKKILEQITRKATKAGMMVSLENHCALADSVMDDWKPFSIELANMLIKEFSFTTPSDKTLIHIIANSYIRVLSTSNKITSLLASNHSSLSLNLLSVLSKELDRAERHYLTAFSLLKHSKDIPIEVYIKTNTAFVAKNQQLNNNQTSNENTTP